MKTVKISSNWLAESHLRMDASYHLSEGVNAKRLIEKFCPFETVKLKEEASDLFKGNIHKRVYVSSPEQGLMFYSASDLFKSNMSSGKYVSKKYSPHLEDLELKKEWILVTRSGTLGKVTYTSSDHEGKIGTDDLIRIKPSDMKIRKGFLYAFLSSKFGYGLVTQSGYGGVVKHIEPHHIENISIPVFPDFQQNKINNLITDSSILRVEANKLLTEANDLFINHLKIDSNTLDFLTRTLEREINSSFRISSSKISSWTLRGRNYSPRKQKIISVLSSGPHDLLGDVLKTDPFYGARYKRIESYSLNSVELLSQGDIFDIKPTGRSIALRSIKNIDQELVSRETILVPAQGTLGENEIFGRAKFVWGYLEGKVVAGHAMRFIADTDKIPSGYLFTVLNSPLWFRLFRNTVYGTNLLGFIVPLLKNLPIPRFEINQELEIDQMVKQAYDKLTLANLKESDAVLLVENEIESWQKN